MSWSSQSALRRSGNWRPKCTTDSVNDWTTHAHRVGLSCATFSDGFERSCMYSISILHMVFYSRCQCQRPCIWRLFPVSSRTGSGHSVADSFLSDVFTKRWHSEAMEGLIDYTSMVCEIMWSFIVRRRRKLLPHVTQENGFSPVWMLMWANKVLFWMKLLPHVTQENGFSPVWVLMWSNKWLLLMKLLPHVTQENGFSPVWILMWANKWARETKLLPHVSQE